MITEDKIIELARDAGFSVTKENDIVVRCDYNDEWGVKDELMIFANALHDEFIRELRHIDYRTIISDDKYRSVNDLGGYINKLYALPNDK